MEKKITIGVLVIVIALFGWWVNNVRKLPVGIRAQNEEVDNAYYEGGIPGVNVREYGAVGDGVTDDTTAFENAQASLGSAGGTLLIPSGDFVLNDFEPANNVRFLGTGIRRSRIKGTTSHPILIRGGTTTHCVFEHLALVTIEDKSCVKTEDDGYAGHFGFYNCSFEAPSEYGCYGNFVLSRWDNCMFGYWPAYGSKLYGGVYLKASSDGYLASNQNIFTFCKFYNCETAAVTIMPHGYNNAFYNCDFESLDDKVADITGGDRTIFHGCWAENINIVNNAENCVIRFGKGNTGTNIIDGFRLTGRANYTNKFFNLASAIPKIRYQNCYTDYDNFTVITLTGDDVFWYYSNDNRGSNVAVDDSGSYTYYKDGYLDITSGTAKIDGGYTSVRVAHGLIDTPSAININFTNQGINDYGRWWLSDIDDANFILNVSQDPGEDGLGFTWEAKVAETIETTYTSLNIAPASSVTTSDSVSNDTTESDTTSDTSTDSSTSDSSEDTDRSWWWRRWRR